MDDKYTENLLMKEKRMYGDILSWSTPAAMYFGERIEPNSYYLFDSSCSPLPCTVQVNSCNAFKNANVVAGYIKNCLLRDVISFVFCLSEKKDDAIIHNATTATMMLKQKRNDKSINESELNRCIVLVKYNCNASV